MDDIQKIGGDMATILQSNLGQQHLLTTTSRSVMNTDPSCDSTSYTPCIVNITHSCPTIYVILYIIIMYDSQQRQCIMSMGWKQEKLLTLHYLRSNVVSLLFTGDKTTDYLFRFCQQAGGALTSQSICQDRNRHAGGIAIYTQDCIQTAVALCHPTIEFLLISVKLESKNVMLGLLNCPPRVDLSSVILLWSPHLRNSL